MNKWIAPAVISLFSSIGAWAAYQALLAHFGKSESGLCTLGEAFSCDVVNQSIYSEVFGIPFALLGIIGYGGALLLTGSLLVHRDKQEREVLFLMLCGLTTLGLGIQIYLTFIEAFVIRIWCTMCLVSQVSIAIITLAAWLWRKQDIS